MFKNLILLAILCTIKQQSKKLISSSFKLTPVSLFHYHFIGRPKENGKIIKRSRRMNPHAHVVILQQFPVSYKTQVTPAKQYVQQLSGKQKLCKVMTLSESCVVELVQSASAS